MASGGVTASPPHCTQLTPNLTSQAGEDAEDSLKEFLDKDEEEEVTESKVMAFQIRQKEIENVQRRLVVNNQSEPVI